MRAGNELGLGAAGNVRLEYSVRIIEIRDDNREAREELLQGSVECSLFGKETGQCPRIDGTDLLHQTGCFGQRGDLGIAENFDQRPRELLAERGKHRQGQNKVPDCAAAHDENFPEAHVTRKAVGSVRCWAAIFRSAARCSAWRKTVSPSTTNRRPNPAR